MGQHRGLADLGRHEALVGALEAEAREVEAEEVVGLLERPTGDREGLRERLAHAHLLRPLAGEEQRDQLGLSVPWRGHAIDLMPTPRATEHDGRFTRVGRES